jgi:hypothetical protein
MRNDDFIEVFDGVLTPETCADIVRRFESSGQAQPGLVGGGLYPDLKDSSDIGINGKPEWRDVEVLLVRSVLAATLQYLRRYPYALIAPLMLERGEGEKRERVSAEVLAAMPDVELEAIVRSVFRPGRINLQRYRGGQGGYPYWHCELYPRDARCETLHRHLLWTLYLNDGFAAGETEFLYQNRKIAPRTGSLVIAPAAFTHTHRGNRPEGGDKYIATSWILFNRAEQIFGQA